MPPPKPKATRSLAGGAGATFGDDGPASASAPQQAEQQPQQATRQPGTGFVNLQDILAANRSGAQQMGQGLVNNAQAQGQQAQQAIQAGQQAFQNQVAGGTLTYDQDRPKSKEEAQALAGQGYSGPSGYAETQLGSEALTSQVNKAQDDAKALTSMGGRAALLRRGVSGPYGAGSSALDAYLSGAGMGGQGQQVASTFANLSDILAQARGGTGALIDKARADSTNAAGEYGTLAAGWNALAGDNAGQPLSATPPKTLGDVYTRRNDPNYLNAGDPRFNRPPKR